MQFSTTLTAAIGAAAVLAATASACSPNPNPNPTASSSPVSSAPTTPDGRMPVQLSNGRSTQQDAFAIDAHTWVTPSGLKGTLNIKDENQNVFSTSTVGCAHGVQVLWSPVIIDLNPTYPLENVTRPTSANINGTPVTVSPAGRWAVKISPASALTPDVVKYLKGYDIEDPQGRALGVFTGGAVDPNAASVRDAEKHPCH